MVVREYKHTTGVDPSGQWAMEDFREAVWKFTRGGDSPELNAVVVPEGYVPQLLTPYINGKPCTLDSFDAALEELGYTRTDVMTGIRSAS